MRTVAYARVSSKEQAEDSSALEQQIARLKAAGAEKVYSEVVSAYKNAVRPELDKVLELVRSRQCDRLIITRIDRLSRRGLTAMGIFELFLETEVELKILDEPFDLSTAAGRMQAGQLVVFAEYHSAQKAESVRHGWEHLRNQKKAVSPPFGYIVKDNKHCLDFSPFLCLLEGRVEKSKGAIAREIVEAFLEGKSLRQGLRIINERYGIYRFSAATTGRVTHGILKFSPGGLRNYLTSPILRGHLCYLRKKDKRHQPENKWIIYPDTHPDAVLISPEEDLEIKELLEHNKRVRGYGKTALKYPLSGLVYCAACRGSCYSCKGRVKTNVSNYYNYYFQCNRWRDRSCTNKKMIRMELVETAVIEVLANAAKSIADRAMQPEVKIDPPQLRLAKEQLAQLEGMAKNAIINDAIAKLKVEIIELKLSIKTPDSPNLEELELLEKSLGCQEFWHSIGDKEKQIVYRRLVDKVLVDSGKVVSVSLKVGVRGEG
jgi:site-specific DNA recombinase